MYKTLEYKDAAEGCTFIDVRSPGEYEEATIPEAVNIPLFSDEERAEIGYTYVNLSIEKAKLIGLEAVGRRLPQIYSDIMQLKNKENKLVFFCARGGMRSGSLCALMNSIGIESYKLSGGYKGYRAFINESLPSVNKDIKYIVLHGKTGTGKTEIIKEMKSRGFDVLDLEYAANHRGSLLGSVGIGKGRSQKAFETIIFESLKGRKSNYVIVEGESKRIGNAIIPEYIFKAMESGIHILVDGDIEYRKNIIIKEYTQHNSSIDDLLKGMESLKKYINHERIESHINNIKKHNFGEVAEDLMVKYYDPMYMNEIKKYKIEFVLGENDIEKNSSVLETWYKSHLVRGRTKG